MAYSIRHGIDKDGMDNTQRGLLIGLPAIALVLSFGAAHHAGSPKPKQTAKTIPVVSSLQTSGAPDNNVGGSGSTNASSASSSGSSASGAPVSGGSVSGGSTSGSGSATGGSGGAGGSGGSGSTGGTGGSGGTTGGLGGGGTAPLPDCSIGQVATVNCRVPSCTPTAILAPGQKAILSINGTCVILN